MFYLIQVLNCLITTTYIKCIYECDNFRMFSFRKWLFSSNVKFPNSHYKHCQPFCLMAIHLVLSEFFSSLGLRFEPPFATRKELKLNLSILFENATFALLIPIQVFCLVQAFVVCHFHQLIKKIDWSQFFCLKNVLFLQIYRTLAKSKTMKGLLAYYTFKIHVIVHKNLFTSLYVILIGIILYQGCARILLDEDTRKKHLKKMRSSKKSELDKIDFVKVRVIKDCSKVVNCPRCGYINGLFHCFIQTTLLSEFLKGCVLVTWFLYLVEL